MATLVPYISGALTIGYLVAATFFLRFWRESRDRLFSFFAAAFALLAVQRLMIALFEPRDAIYLVRLVAFLLILFAIYDKNRAAA